MRCFGILLTHLGSNTEGLFKLLYIFPFHQLVWKKTKQIGAAQAPRSDGRVVVVIRYSPAGNYDGKYKENVLPALSGAGQTRFSFVLVGFVVITGAAFNTFF